MSAWCCLRSAASARRWRPTIEWLIAFRFLQGLGACAGMVVPRAIVRDLHTGTEAAQLMSLLMLVFSVSPILAPLTGSLVIETLRLARRVLGGDRRRAARHRAAGTGAEGNAAGRAARRQLVRQRARRLRLLLGDRNFLGLTLIGGFGIASFFVYLANSSFILIDHYGLSPSVYSVFFSINAVAFFAVSQLTGMLTERFGLRRVVRIAVVGYAAVMVALFAVMASASTALACIAALLFVGYGFLGLVIPTTSVLAMEEHGEIAGTASALMGTLHFVTGAVAMAVAGMFFDGTPLPMVAGIAACAVIAFVLAQVTLGDRRRTVDGRGRGAGGVDVRSSFDALKGGKLPAFLRPRSWMGQNSALAQKCLRQLLPFLIERQGRWLGACAAIPIFRIGLIAFLAMEVGMNMRARFVVALLRAFMRLVPIALGIPPQPLQGRVQPAGGCGFGHRIRSVWRSILSPSRSTERRSYPHQR